MNTMAGEIDDSFHEAVRELLAGDFSRLAPNFDIAPGGSTSAIIAWHDAGLFKSESEALAEAFTCACFLGRTNVVNSLLEKGVSPSGGSRTGSDAFHWAVNRGQLEVVRVLIQAKAPLETRNRFGGTVLGMAVWSAINEPREDHIEIIEELIDGGANIKEAGYPTGNVGVDEVLKRHLGLAQ